MKKIRIVLLSLPFLFGFNLTFSEGCDDYPEQVGIPGIAVEENGSFALKFTQGSEVAFDDYDLMLDSLRRAEAEAKVALADYMEVGVAEGCDNDDTSKQTSANYTLSGKDVEFEKVKDVVCNLSTRTEALIRGAAPIANCYDPGVKVLVTIGIKNEFIDGAEAVRSAMNDSFLRTGGASLQNSECTSEDSDDCEVEEESKTRIPLNKVEAFSNTEKLKKF